MPGKKKKLKHKILFAVDTSGSVSNKDLEEAYSELYHMYKKGVSIDVIHWDTRVVHEYTYKGEHTFPRKTNGGTQITAAIDYFKDHHKDYSSFIIFTDGYVEETNYRSIVPTLTIVCSGGTSSDFDSKLPGKVIHVP
jgi:predicted metal-dependent peptidase